MNTTLKPLITLWVIGSFVLTPIVSAELIISEFQAENLSTLDDEELTSSDWIEIHNNGEATVNLEGYHLTDDPKRLDKWAFPGLSLKAGGYLTVFASEKNQHRALTIFESSNPVKPTHTNFRLAPSGEYLALVEPDGESIIHEYAEEYPRQVGDTSYGIGENGEVGYFKEPTPGAANGPTVPIGPLVKEVINVTGVPNLEETDEVTISAEIIENEHPVAKVNLFHRFMFKSESRTEMKDDGVAPDETAGDSIYTASFDLSSIFGASVQAGEMIRWRVEAEDDQGNTQRSPLFHDPDNADEYYGTVVYDSSIETSNLTVLHWFIENPNSANNDRGTKASVSYLGEFYDNIHVDIHGQSTRGFPKKSWDFDFNTGHRFKYHEDEDRVKDFNLLTNWADKSKVRNTMAYEMYRMGGVAAHFAFSVRVQQNGEFYGTWDMVEDGDEIYLDRAGLSRDGALYKVYNRLDARPDSNPFSQNGYEKKTRRFEAKEDVNDLYLGMRGSSSDKLTYTYDNIDIPSYVNFLVMNSTTNNTDYGHKNYYVYRDTEGTGEWTQLPWDVDLSIGRRWISGQAYFFDPIQTTHSPVVGHEHGNAMGTFFMGNSVLREMIYRRLRTTYDYFYGPPGGQPESDYFERRLNELVELVDPEGVVSDADLEYEKWGSWGNRDTMREAVDRIRNEYIPGRRDYIYGLRDLPNAQRPYADFKIDVVEVAYNTGNQLEEYFVIQNLTGQAIDLTGFQIAGAVEHTISPGTVLLSGSIFDRDLGKLYLVRDARAFRARKESPTGGENLFVQGNYNGQLSSRGETIQILDPDGNVVTDFTYEGEPSAPQQYLRITELLYNPADADEGSGYKSKDYEYIELTNTGSEALDLSGVSFIDGVRFDFAEGATLAPGAHAVLVSNQTAFESRFGTDITILGEFEGNLSNGGDRIVLQDANDENVLAFSYEEDWFETADQEGYALEVVNPDQAVAQWDLAEGWKVSIQVGGTPGNGGDGDPINPPSGMTYATWQAEHFSEAEIADDSISGALADANGDGSANLLAYAMNASPHEPIKMPRVAAGPDYLTITFTRHTNANDLVYRAEGSSDLETWKPLEAQVGDIVAGANQTETITLRSVERIDAIEANHVRLAVELK